MSKSATVARVMEDFARKLNLKAHQVNGVRLFTPGDREAHHGFDDKDYLVDTSKKPSSLHLANANECFSFSKTVSVPNTVPLSAVHPVR